jgi:hypothetical protein
MVEEEIVSRDVIADRNSLQNVTSLHHVTRGSPMEAGLTACQQVCTVQKAPTSSIQDDLRLFSDLLGYHAELFELSKLELGSYNPLSNAPLFANIIIKFNYLLRPSHKIFLPHFNLTCAERIVTLFNIFTDLSLNYLLPILSC